MSNVITSWRPSWWTEQVHGSAWERVKGALERDWAQTKHDMQLGGHEMNQGIKDTVAQAAGRQHLPTMNQANPPKWIGSWSEAEVPYAYGYGARRQFGAQHPQWNEGLELKLESEWRAAVAKQARPDWAVVAVLVRRAYEYGEAKAAADALGVADTKPQARV